MIKRIGITTSQTQNTVKRNPKWANEQMGRPRKRCEGCERHKNLRMKRWKNSRAVAGGVTLFLFLLPLSEFAQHPKLSLKAVLQKEHSKTLMANARRTLNPAVHQNRLQGSRFGGWIAAPGLGHWKKHREVLSFNWERETYSDWRVSSALTSNNIDCRS